MCNPTEFRCLQSATPSGDTGHGGRNKGCDFMMPPPFKLQILLGAIKLVPFHLDKYGNLLFTMKILFIYTYNHTLHIRTDKFTTYVYIINLLHKSMYVIVYLVVRV